MQKPLVCHVITGLGNGGAEGVLARLCIHDSSLRHVVISLTTTGTYGQVLEDHGISVHWLGMGSGRGMVQALRDLTHLLQVQSPRVVQTWMYHADLLGGIAARLARVPRICWGIRNLQLDVQSSKKSTILVRKLSAVLSSIIPHAIVVCAENAAIEHQRIGYSSKKMELIPNGYDLSVWYPDQQKRDQIRSELGLDRDIPVLGMVARQDPQKDHPNLFGALELLKKAGIPFRCLLVGKAMDQENQALVDLLKNHNLTQEVFPLGQRNDIPAIMNALDLLVLSSYSEAFPNVLAEAMASGTPCVATDVGDAKEIVGATGWIVPPKDSQALATALQAGLEQLKDSSQLTRLQAAARDRILERYELQQMITKYHKVWDLCAE